MSALDDLNSKLALLQTPSKETAKKLLEEVRKLKQVDGNLDRAAIIAATHIFSAAFQPTSYNYQGAPIRTLLEALVMPKERSKFLTRRFWTNSAPLIIVVALLLGSIHGALADEASDAAQVLSKLWMATLDAHFRFADAKTYTHRNVFVGDSKTYKMRDVFREDDGTIEVSTEEAPFRVLEEDLNPFFLSIYPPSSLVGVKCLFGLSCIKVSVLKYDPIYNPNAQPKMSWHVPMPYSDGAVKPEDADTVRRALRTLLRLNAAAPFDPDAPR